VHIYLNDNGTLATTPSWTYDSPTVGTAIAFGDINGDGRPDLVVGNSGDPCVKVFYAVSLAADSAQIPASTGATINFALDAGALNAGRTYLLAGGSSGTDPGTVLPGGMAAIPLNRDRVTDYILARLNTPGFADFFGTLDGNGEATAQLNAPPLPPSWAGTTLHFAYALAGPWDFASMAVVVEVVP
jgi:hypothetical protein